MCCSNGSGTLGEMVTERYRLLPLMAFISREKHGKRVSRLLPWTQPPAGGRQYGISSTGSCVAEPPKVHLASALTQCRGKSVCVLLCWEAVYQHAHPCENTAPIILPRSVYPRVMCCVTVSEIKVASGFLKFMHLNCTNFSLEGERENTYLGNTN